jgi:hypothetical protein
MKRCLPLLCIGMILAMLPGWALAEMEGLSEVKDAQVRALAGNLFDMGLKDAALRVLANYRAGGGAMMSTVPAALPSVPLPIVIQPPTPLPQTPAALPSPPDPTPPVSWEEPELRAVQLLEDTGAHVQVRQFVFNRTQLIPEDVLQGLLADLVGKELNVPKLKTAALRITEHYRAKGHVAKAVLPEQSLEFGLVRIYVLEGRPRLRE